MSFLSELVSKKQKLKSCQTVVTSLAGDKYLEKKTKGGKMEIRKLSETCPGFVVDEELDLQIAEVLEFLCLSSQDVAQDLDLLKKNRITHVLSVGVVLPPPDASCNIEFKSVELLDEPKEDLLKVLHPCFEFIESARLRSEKSKVLVHCNAGYSRAPAVIIAYLMTKQGYSFAESYKMVKEKRDIKPNEGFTTQLKNLKKIV